MAQERALPPQRGKISSADSKAILFRHATPIECRSFGSLRSDERRREIPRDSIERGNNSTLTWLLGFLQSFHHPVRAPSLALTATPTIVWQREFLIEFFNYDTKHEGEYNEIKRFHFFIVVLGLFRNIAIVAAQHRAPVPAFKEKKSRQYKFSQTGGINSWATFLIDIHELTIVRGKVTLYRMDGNHKHEVE